MFNSSLRQNKTMIMTDNLAQTLTNDLDSRKKFNSLSFSQHASKCVTVEGFNKVFQSDIDESYREFICRQCEIVLPYQQKHRKFVLDYCGKISTTLKVPKTYQGKIKEIVYLCWNCNRNFNYNKIRDKQLSRTQWILKNKRRSVCFYSSKGRKIVLHITLYEFNGLPVWLVRKQYGVIKWIEFLHLARLFRNDLYEKPKR